MFVHCCEEIRTDVKDFFSLYNGLAVYLSLWILFHLFSVVMFVKPPSVGLINFQFEHFSFQTFDRELVHLRYLHGSYGFWKVLDSFRNFGVYFSGTGKFWKVSCCPARLWKSQCIF